MTARSITLIAPEAVRSRGWLENGDRPGVAIAILKPPTLYLYSMLASRKPRPIDEPGYQIRVHLPLMLSYKR